MLKRLACLVGLVLLFAFAAQPARADDPPGAKLFTNYCSGCHGAAGQGGSAPDIGAGKYLSAHDDAAITQAISDGMTTHGMPAWSKAKGGTLSDSQITDLVAYLRSLATTTAPAAAQVEQAPNTVIGPTKLTVKQLMTGVSDFVLRAMLTDEEGYPVGGASIDFTWPTTFGVIELGTAKTGANGMAQLQVHGLSAGAREVAATFKGDRSASPSAAKITLAPQQLAQSSGGFKSNGVRLAVGDEPLVAPEGSLITPNPPLIPALLFALVVGCVWAMYAFVVSQIVGIWREGRIPNRENMFTRNAK